MSINTITFQNGNAFEVAIARLEQFSARVLRSLTSWNWSARAVEPYSAEELLKWADEYEATQPSYAADLRAAALRHLSGR